MKPICGCKHHASYHDPLTGACTSNDPSVLTGYDQRDNPVYEIRQCGCRKYTRLRAAARVLRSRNRRHPVNCILGHDHKPVRAQNATVNDAPVTYILLRCSRCGDVRSEELYGTWSLADVI